nr:unnamed protein product [Callosobruchus analis]
MGNVIYSIIWLLILFFISFFVAGFCAGFYIILHPLSVCLPPLTVSIVTSCLQMTFLIYILCKQLTRHARPSPRF